MPEKLLLDTDIGSDIDDAVCLAYLLAQPECELLGITTVSGEPVKRAMLASALCRAAGEDVPIYPGTAEPLVIEQKQPAARQAEALGRWPHDTSFPAGEATDFLRSTIRAHPGEVTLLAVGPMTNLGRLFRADPEIPGLLKRLALMCGVFQDTRQAGGITAEWNARCDPHAANIVYRADAREHLSVGLDVTTRVRMDASEARARFTGPLLAPVLDFAEVWFRETERPVTFHDPLAAAALFEPGLCGFERGRVKVELEDESALGATRWTPDTAAGPHWIASTVEPGRFFEHYLSVTAS